MQNCARVWCIIIDFSAGTDKIPKSYRKQNQRATSNIKLYGKNYFFKLLGYCIPMGIAMKLFFTTERLPQNVLLGKKNHRNVIFFS